MNTIEIFYFYKLYNIVIIYLIKKIHILFLYLKIIII